MAGHTPGPWSFGHMGDGERYWIGPDHMHQPVATADRDMPEANARLIAAAPDLLEALKLARSICHDAFKDTAMEWDEESMGVIDAAIAKAEGSQ
jgi:hypothetical protein